MTPKEKAEKLVDSLYYVIGKNYSKGDGFGLQLFNEAKQCALIAVDEILSAIGFSVNDEYWGQVKQEIEKL